LVDIGGYRLHIHVTGKGDPTVVLIAGAGDFSFDWSLVQPGVARFTRVCSYDRAGSAWSDLGPTPRTMKQEAYELHLLLQKAGLRGPFILVGHSQGGLIARVYADQYPEEVAGMVLADSTHEDTTLMIQGKLVHLGFDNPAWPLLILYFGPFRYSVLAPPGVDPRGCGVCLLSERTTGSWEVGTLRFFRSERAEARERRKNRAASGVGCTALRDQLVQRVPDGFRGCGPLLVFLAALALLPTVRAIAEVFQQFADGALHQRVRQLKRCVPARPSGNHPEGTRV
jgi:pimeloyl-ACP methyl ester carboxylesterase